MLIRSLKSSAPSVLSGAVAVVLMMATAVAVEVDPTWDLTDLYPDVAAWEQAMAEIPAMMAELEPYRGTLGDGAANLREALDHYYAVRKELKRLLVYASILADSDTREPGPQGMKQAVGQLRAEFKASSSKPPVEILRDAGVDMTTAEPFDAFFGAMEGIISQIEEILDREG